MADGQVEKIPMNAKIIQWITLFLLSAYSSSGTAFQAQPDGTNDPWAPFHLVSIKSKSGTLYLDPDLASKSDEIKFAVEEVLAHCEQLNQRFRAFLQKNQKIISLVNEILGYTPNEKQAAMQKKMLKELGNGLLRFNLLPAEKLRVYILLKTKTKEYLREGGKLPGFSHDPKLDKIGWSVKWLISTETNSTRTSDRTGLEWFPFVVDSQTSAVTNILDYKSSNLSVFLSLIREGMMIHELVELTLYVQMPKFRDPLYRWFMDGFANAIALEILKKLDEKDALEEMRKAYDIAEYTDIRQELNLRYWPMGPYCIESPLKAEERLNSARYAYATFEATRLIEKYELGSVREIISQLQDNVVNNSDDLVEAIERTTGEDMSEYLQNYQRFRTTRQGMDIYTKACYEAENEKDDERVFFNACRLTEIALHKGFGGPKAYFAAAEMLNKLGYREAGSKIFEGFIASGKRSRSAKDVKTWQNLFMRYALYCNDLPMVYGTADDYLKAYPNDVLAAIIHAHQLKAEGRTKEAIALAKSVRSSVIKLDNPADMLKLLKIIDEIVATENKY